MITYEILDSCFDKNYTVDLHLDISYSEAERTTELVIILGGREYDPFRHEDDSL